MEWGTPGGKNQRSFTPTSLTNPRPCRSSAVMRALPLSMMAHSAASCQCSSRMPPAVSRMFTPAMSLEIGKSSTVTCRVQPPGCTRRWAIENEFQNSGASP